MNTEKSGGNSNSNNKSELKKAKSTRKSLTFLTENNVALVGEAIARAHLEVNDELHRATDVDDNLSGTPQSQLFSLKIISMLPMSATHGQFWRQWLYPTVKRKEKRVSKMVIVFFHC